MNQTFNNIRFKIYDSIVNRNEIVRDFYQIPCIINPKRHKKQRLFEWGRLLWLLIMYRLLKCKLSAESQQKLYNLRKKRDELWRVNDICEISKSALDKIKRSDLWVSGLRTNVLVYGFNYFKTAKWVTEEINKLLDNNLIIWSVFESDDYFFPAIFCPAQKIFELLESNPEILEKDNYCEYYGLYYRMEYISSAVEKYISEKKCDNSRAVISAIAMLHQYLDEVIMFIKPRFLIINGELTYERILLEGYCKNRRIPYKTMISRG